jgi:hypothetical protein
MKQTIEISNEIAVSIQQYLQKNPNLTLSDLVQEALAQKFALDQLEETSGLASPDPQQIEKFMALSGIVQQAQHHSDEHAEDHVD